MRGACQPSLRVCCCQLGVACLQPSQAPLLLTWLQEIAPFLRVLGSYPSDTLL